MYFRKVFGICTLFPNSGPTFVRCFILRPYKCNQFYWCDDIRIFLKMYISHASPKAYIHYVVSSFELWNSNNNKKAAQSFSLLVQFSSMCSEKHLNSDARFMIKWSAAVWSNARNYVTQQFTRDNVTYLDWQTHPIECVCVWFFVLWRIVLNSISIAIGLVHTLLWVLMRSNS